MAAIPSSTPKINAPRVETACRASGRVRVRRMTASMSASTTQFSAFALPAARVPPTRVAIIRPSGGTCRCAANIAGMVVISSSSMIRGLVSAT